MYPLKIDGRLIEFPSKADAEAFLINKVLAAPVSQEVEPRRITRVRSVPSDDTQANTQNTKMVREFVSTITSAGSHGTDTSRIMKAVGINSPVAFGNRGKNINKLLVKLGFEPREVYTNERNENGDREWKPGPKATEALQKLKEFATG